MRLRTAAAVAAALSVLALVPASASGAPEAPRGLVATPAAGDCHDLTYDEAMKKADPKAPVSCTDEHTTVTTKVITFDSAPNWASDALRTKVSIKCQRASIDFFDNKAKALQLSAYTNWIFYPTKAQRDAGAKWARCDIALYGKESLKPLPTDGGPELDALPLPDAFAKCRQGKTTGYSLVSCDHPHRFHATVAIKRPGSYPGTERMVKWTIDHCRAKLGRSFGYYSAPTRMYWKGGYRYSLCYRTTQS